MEPLVHLGLTNALAASILALVVASVSLMIRRPALRHCLWLLVLVKLVSPPIWFVPISWTISGESKQPPAMTLALVTEPLSEPKADLSLPASAPEEVDIPDLSLDIGVAALPQPAEQTIPDEAPPTSEPVPDSNPSWEYPTWELVIGVMWLTGSTAWFFLALCRLRWFHLALVFAERGSDILQERTSRLCQRLGIKRSPVVWLLPAPITPMIWAVAGGPRLLVPKPWWERLTTDQQDTLLIHELAHLFRKDHWVRLLELAITGLFWWHPVVWWARREIREAEEQCCDAWVVWALPRAASTYALTLVETVNYLSAARLRLPPAASGIGHFRLLRRRLTMIMKGTTPRALDWLGILLVVGLGAVVLPLLPSLAQPPAPEEHATVGQDPNLPPPPPPPIPATRRAPMGGLPDAADRGRVRESMNEPRDEVELCAIQLEGKRAEMAETQARLQMARGKAERSEKLKDRGAIGDDEVQQARGELEIMQARLMGKNALVKEAELRLKQAKRRLAMQNLGDRRGGIPGARRGAPPAGGLGGQGGPGLPPPGIPNGENEIGVGIGLPGGGDGFGNPSPPGPRGGANGIGGSPPPQDPRVEPDDLRPSGGIGLRGGSSRMAAGGFGGGMQGALSGPMGGQNKRMADLEKKLDRLIDEVKKLQEQVQESRKK